MIHTQNDLINFLCDAVENNDADAIDTAMQTVQGWLIDTHSKATLERLVFLASQTIELQQELN